MLVKDRMTINDTLFPDNLLDMLVLHVVHTGAQKICDQGVRKETIRNVVECFRTLTKI